MYGPAAGLPNRHQSKRPCIKPICAPVRASQGRRRAGRGLPPLEIARFKAFTFNVDRIVGSRTASTLTPTCRPNAEAAAGSSRQIKRRRTGNCSTAAWRAGWRAAPRAVVSRAGASAPCGAALGRTNDPRRTRLKPGRKCMATLRQTTKETGDRCLPLRLLSERKAGSTERRGGQKTDSQARPESLRRGGPGPVARPARRHALRTQAPDRCGSRSHNARDRPRSRDMLRRRGTRRCRCKRGSLRRLQYGVPAGAATDTRHERDRHHDPAGNMQMSCGQDVLALVGHRRAG